MSHPVPAVAGPHAAARSGRATVERPALRAWARERFPARNLAFFALLYATNAAAARAAAAPGPLALGWRDLTGVAAVTAFFLVLRVCDEHKDFAADAVAHAGRALQRGLVTLADLRRVGAAAVLAQLAASLWHDGGAGPATAVWVVAAGWAALMTHEFFAPVWLRARPVAYLLTHMPIMALIALWAAALGLPGQAPNTTLAGPGVLACVALALAAGLVAEVGRKLRAAADEHPMADSYTRALGVRGAAAALAALIMAAGAAALGAASAAAHGPPPVAAVAAVILATVLGVGAASDFARAPTTARAKRVEIAAGAAVLAGHAAVLGALVLARGVRVA